ncbi:MAG: (2Fe-2S)-binding protein [candidate division KSB1 bacterium]|nr:(2Fe-2S)-binding protein [candidate division KSB1 bacterium]
MMEEKNIHNGLSRRGFLKGVSGGLIGAAALKSIRPLSAAAEHGRIVGPDSVTITLQVNGEQKRVQCDPRTTLLDLLRDAFGLTGTKRVCNKGQCGACTVILDGRTVLACSMLALDADGCSVETIEGVARGDRLHPLQEAFVENDALQCGFCTPGFIMSGLALLRRNPKPTLEEIKRAVSGNLCRCGTYPNVFKAVAQAAERMQKEG